MEVWDPENTTSGFSDRDFHGMKGNSGNSDLTLPRLLGYINESEESTYDPFNF